MQRQERGRKEPSEFNVIVKCKDLIKHTFTITNSTERFPKKYRFTLVNRIQDKAVDIYECALEANELNLLDAQEFKERQRLQAKAMTYCKELLFFKVYPAAAIHSGGKYRIADARAFRAAEGKGYKQRGYFL